MDAALNALGMAAPIVVGTLHKLAGGNWPMVIFSSAYTFPDQPSYVFDQDTSFLNVAVSRARDAFLLFGDMGVHGVAEGMPSQLLARHMSYAPESEIHVDPGWPLHHELIADNLPGGYAVLSSFQHHQHALTNAFERAAKRIVMVSPWLGAPSALCNALGLLVAQVAQRGVSCLLYVSPVAGVSCQEPACQRLLAMLEEAGAKVELVSGIRSNLLCIDDTDLYSGSYHWLSADPPSRLAGPRKTVHYRSPQVISHLAPMLAALQRRRAPASDGQ